MTTRDNGGPAFPGLQYTSGRGCTRVGVTGEFEEHDPGMSLLDYFAAAAVTGLAANPESWTVHPDKMAEFAYDLAESMLAERNKPATEETA